MESLELRRSVTRRETEVYLMALLYAALAVVAVWWTVGLWLDAGSVLRGSGTERAWVLPVAGVVTTALTLLLLWWGTPYWQLALRPGRADDVIAAFDREGMLLRDAGFRIHVPWSSVGSMRMEPLAEGRAALVATVPGPVDRSRGLLPTLVVRGLRRGTFRLRLEPDDPTPEETRAGVHELSGGTVVVD